MSADLDAIRERCDLVEIARGYLTLRKSGRNWTGLCPFHQERTPSFSIDAEKGVWHCFGCGEGGDLFAFVERIEQTDFKGALRILSEKAGIELTPQNSGVSPPRPGRRPKERKPAQGSRPHTVRKGARIVSDAVDREKPKNPMLTSTQTGGKWRQELKGVVPLAGSPGAAYLESRGVPLDVAEAAGVKYHPGYYGVEAIVFAVRDPAGNLVSAQGRTIKRPWVDREKRERTKETAHGTQLTAGAFWTAGARDRSLPIIAITESPLDSLALAAAGLPGFALCGKAVRGWADEFTSWRRTLLAFDATAETESGRPLENWRAALTCGQRVERLCPPVKDWALMAETRGIDAIRAYVEAFLAGPSAVAMCIECGQPGAPWEGATCKACDIWAEA